ncbi:MAG: serine protease [Alphaproteobacteria bacterium]|nr:serine protease [Alphaproteobacteria bacterium]
MAIERANGHKPAGLLHMLHPTMLSAPRPKPESLGYDLEALLPAMILLTAHIPEDAYTAPMLGTERTGNGVLIDDQGLILTIGYLISEAQKVHVNLSGGRTVDAEIVAYDYHTGFGLLRTHRPVDIAPMPLGAARDVAEGDAVVVAAYGGMGHALAGAVVSKRPFAGYWEYMLEEAIYTTPPHPNWSGTALIAPNGRMAGIGSLFVEDARSGAAAVSGNMFVPADLLPPIQDELLRRGRAADTRPYLAMYSTEAYGRVVVTSLSAKGPAERAGIKPGDVIVTVNGTTVEGLGDLYRKLWKAGPAGSTVSLGVVRDGKLREIAVQSRDRYDFLKTPRPH